MFVRTYAPGKTVVTFLGQIISGFGDEIVTCKRTEEVFKMEVGADGEVSRRQSANKSGEVKISCKQTSDSHFKLGTIMRTDELVGQQVGPVLVADNLGNTLWAGEGWIRGWPELKRHKDEQNHEWTLDCSELEFEFSPLPANV